VLFGQDLERTYFENLTARLRWCVHASDASDA
jgi:hypothetical protein